MNTKTVEKIPDNQEDLIYGLKGLRELLGGVSTTTALRIKKQLPHYQNGRVLFFKKSEVLAAMSKNQTAE